MKDTTRKKLIPALITVLLFGIIVSQIRIEDLISTIQNINKTYLIFGFFLYTLSYLLRGLRFHLLLGKKVSIKDLFHVVCVHNMVNSILPARSGELSYIYILNKYHDKSTGEGVATLLVARVLDFIIISSLFFVSSLFVKNIPETFSSIIGLVVLFTALLAVFLIVLLYAGEFFLRFANAVFINLKLEKNRLVNFFLRKSKEIVSSFKDIKNNGNMIELFILSLLIWITLYSINYTLIKSLSLNINFFEVLLASTFVVFMSVLPVQGMGGFGTYEAGWTIGFVGIGLSKELAINSGIVVHIIGIVYYVLLGLYGYQYLCKKHIGTSSNES